MTEPQTISLSELHQKRKIEVVCKVGTFEEVLYTIRYQTPMGLTAYFVDFCDDKENICSNNIVDIVAGVNRYYPLQVRP